MENLTDTGRAVLELLKELGEQDQQKVLCLLSQFRGLSDRDRLHALRVLKALRQSSE